MKVIEVDVNKLIPYTNNPRKNDRAVDPVANSIREFGFKVPLVIDNKNNVVCGHTRLKAAKKLGMKTVPCIIADGLSEEQIKAFRLADNKVGELAEWDFDLLGEELDGIFDIDMSEFGFADSGEPLFGSMLEDFTDSHFDNETFGITFEFDATKKHFFDAYLKANGKQGLVELTTSEVISNAP